jgi:hypothetical protein
VDKYLILPLFLIGSDNLSITDALSLGCGQACYDRCRLSFGGFVGSQGQGIILPLAEM